MRYTTHPHVQGVEFNTSGIPPRELLQPLVMDVNRMSEIAHAHSDHPTSSLSPRVGEVDPR